MQHPYTLRQGDCLDVLRTLPDRSVDSIVTDPPYGLSFMGKRWDYDVPGVEVWAECLRVLKPGGHLLAFAGTRTQHRMAVRIEDAGFEIRDMIAWVYGSGFPKSLDVSKAIDKTDAAEAQERRRLAFTAWVRSQGITSRQIDEATGTNMGGHYTTSASQPAIMTRAHLEACRHLFADVPEWVEREADKRTVESENFKRREVVGRKMMTDTTVARPACAYAAQELDGAPRREVALTTAHTDAARQWQGWGTALKPALETVTFASKPYTPDQERNIIKSNLIRLEARLWLLSSASAAERSSTSNPSEYGAACAIAQWSADEITSTRAALCDPMGTSLFELATNTSLSIVSSWRRTLAESWSDGSTSTIETRSSTTIDWRTLKFSLSQITPSTIIEACSRPGGFSANASTAESHFNASLSLLQSIRTLSATEPAISLEAESYRGAGVKPSLDPCIMARKPLVGTVAENVLAHGTGAINVDWCRVPDSDHESPAGRWPANLIHDGSDEPAGLLGDAARFFYCAKASKRDRDEGLEGFVRRAVAGVGALRDGGRESAPRSNTHPTVKPTDLMRYLCRLVTPPGGVVLDPFMGSGSTGKAAVLEGFQFVGVEREAEYVSIADARISSTLYGDLA